MPEAFDIVIVGSGPAGLAAGEYASGRGCRTLMLEKMPRTAVKMLASGGGRCNFSNNLPEEEFMASFGRSGRFMSEALKFAGRDWLLGHLRGRGVAAVLENGRFYFPAAGGASAVISSFMLPARKNGLEVRTGCEAVEIITAPAADRPRAAAVRCSTGEIIPCRAVIIASGGPAAPRLGGSSSGMRLAAKLGHTVIPPVPALAPLVIREAWPGSLAGVSLPEAEVICGEKREKRVSREALLFTREGLSGSAALNLSGTVHRRLASGPVKILLRCLPELSRSGWEALLRAAAEKSPGRLLRNVLAASLPRSLAAALCREAGEGESCCRELGTKRTAEAAALLDAVPLTVERAGGFETAMACDGGVSLKEISPREMESRLVSGVFFAGEVMDLVGPCGGYNIQFAIASGRLAASSATESLSTMVPS